MTPGKFRHSSDDDWTCAIDYDTREEAVAEASDCCSIPRGTEFRTGRVEALREWLDRDNVLDMIASLETDMAQFNKGASQRWRCALNALIPSGDLDLLVPQINTVWRAWLQRFVEVPRPFRMNDFETHTSA